MVISIQILNMCGSRCTAKSLKECDVIISLSYIVNLLLCLLIRACNGCDLLVHYSVNVGGLQFYCINSHAIWIGAFDGPCMHVEVRINH